MNPAEEEKQSFAEDDRSISNKTSPENKIYSFRREFNKKYQNSAINFLIYGQVINKFTRKGSSHLVIFFICQDNMNYL
jgi:hypothetical protein